MGLMNLATCFGPNLLKFKQDEAQAEDNVLGSLILDTPVVNEITQTLIQHGEEIFRIGLFSPSTSLFGWLTNAPFQWRKGIQGFETVHPLQCQPTLHLRAG